MRFGRNEKAVERGQGTVEAAFVLPVLLGLVLFLLQPGIVLYDRVVMKSAAAEACRLLIVSGSDFGESEEAVKGVHPSSTGGDSSAGPVSRPRQWLFLGYRFFWR